MHAVAGLFRVQLGLVLRDRHLHALDQTGARTFSELHVRRAQDASRHLKFFLERPVGAVTARKPVQVIDDDEAAFPEVPAQILDEGAHGWPVADLSRQHFVENFHDLVSHSLGIYPAGPFLRVQAVAVRFLLTARNAAVDDCLQWLGGAGVRVHESLFPAAPST
ncbi:MAG TPA: hypothetical protein VHB50_17980 [Bryobacteraceae bacterium]|nr:hypothetical protein [Bryobacteraceae bacterium]